jgi:hypothetical protein
MQESPFCAECHDYTDESAGAGEKVFVEQRAFFLGQAIHTIGDSFAHTMRVFDYPPNGELFPLVW